MVSRRVRQLSGQQRCRLKPRRDIGGVPCIAIQRGTSHTSRIDRCTHTLQPRSTPLDRPLLRQRNSSNLFGSLHSANHPPADLFSGATSLIAQSYPLIRLRTVEHTLTGRDEAIVVLLEWVGLLADRRRLEIDHTLHWDTILEENPPEVDIEAS